MGKSHKRAKSSLLLITRIEIIIDNTNVCFRPPKKPVLLAFKGFVG